MANFTDSDDQCQYVDSSPETRHDFAAHANRSQFFADAAEYLRTVKESYPSLSKNDLIRINAERLMALAVIKEAVDHPAVFWAETFLKNYKHTLINGHLWMPIFIVVKYYSKNRDQSRFTAMDLIQCGNEGLMNAAKKYTPELFGNTSFSTFAFWEIIDKIQKFVKKEVVNKNKIVYRNKNEDAILSGVNDVEFNENFDGMRLKNLSSQREENDSDDCFENIFWSHAKQEAVRKALSQFSPHDAKFLRIKYGIGTPLVAKAEDIGDMLDFHVKSVYRKDLYLKDKLREILAESLS